MARLSLFSSRVDPRALTALGPTWRSLRSFVGRAACLGLAVVASPAHALLLPCKHEDPLAETAAEYLLTGKSVVAAELLPLARRLGFDGVALHAHDGLDDVALSTWLKGLADRADGPLVCGEAASDTRRLVLVAVRGGRLTVASGVARGQLAPGFLAPSLVIEGVDGSTHRLTVTTQELARGIPLKELADYARVQLVAEGPQGPRPVAELVTADKAQSDAALSDMRTNTQIAPPLDTQRGPRSRPREALIARVDGARRSEGAGSLRGNQLLHTSAQRHAERVCELGKVAHRLDAGDDPETRLREEHIAARSVGEAIARAESSDAALTAIFRSPSHRLAVTEKRFTDVGIGQAFDAKGHTCVVVLLAAWPRRIP